MEYKGKLMLIEFKEEFGIKFQYAKKSIKIKLFQLSQKGV